MHASTIKNCDEALVAKREQLLGRSNNGAGAAPNDSAAVEDQAARSAEQDTDLLLSANAQRNLVRIDAARLRIRNQVYGKCLMCDRSIPVARLNVVPEAECCTGCQDRFDEDVESGTHPTYVNWESLTDFDEDETGNLPVDKVRKQ